MSANVRVLLFVDGQRGAEYGDDQSASEDPHRVPVIAYASALFAPRPPCMALVVDAAHGREVASGWAHYDDEIGRYAFWYDKALLFTCDEHGLRTEKSSLPAATRDAVVARDFQHNPHASVR